MDAFNMVVQVPSWAYDFCFYYLAVAALVTVFSLYSLVKLFMLPSMVQKIVPVTSIAVTLILSGAVTVLLTMMQFWVCRSALAPREKFAVNCGGDRDCQDSCGDMGPSCTCGGRGKCGGCMYRNTQGGGEYAGWEGFVSSSGPHKGGSHSGNHKDKFSPGPY